LKESFIQKTQAFKSNVSVWHYWADWI